MKTSVIIAAGGTASRLDVNGGKQLLALQGIPVAIRACQFFEYDKNISDIVIVIAESDVEVAKGFVEKYNLTKVIDVVKSGNSRQDSVINGFNALPKADAVIIHDGARPFPPEKIVANLIDQLNDFDGAITAVKVTDTIKVVAANDEITNTPDRSNLYAAQTPQAFNYDILKEAYSLNNKERYTDDSAMVEAVGGNVCIVKGSQDNIKITYKKDIAIAEDILLRYSLES